MPRPKKRHKRPGKVVPNVYAPAGTIRDAQFSGRATGALPLHRRWVKEPRNAASTREDAMDANALTTSAEHAIAVVTPGSTQRLYFPEDNG